jgi:hypothetical protein
MVWHGMVEGQAWYSMAQCDVGVGYNMGHTVGKVLYTIPMTCHTTPIRYTIPAVTG